MNHCESNTMNTRFAPSLQEILYRLVGAATEKSTPEQVSTKPGRFPVVVKPETRVFLETQADYLGGSIAGVAGAILDGVAMATQRRDGGTVALRGVAERFNLLIQEHELSFPAAVEALSDLGFTLADLASIEALQLKLSSSIIRQLADRFYVNYDWLVGKSDTPLNRFLHFWYQAERDAADRLVEAKSLSNVSELILLIDDKADLNSTNDDQVSGKPPHFIPVLKQMQELPGGETLERYETWEEGRWSYWRCRDHIKLVIYFGVRLGVHVSGKTISSEDYALLSSGRVLTATIMRRNAGRASWHPDDYVHPDSPVAKAPEEWRSIEASSYYASTFKYFNQLLKDQGVVE
jgi:hypothetical protein